MIEAPSWTVQQSYSSSEQAPQPLIQALSTSLQQRSAEPNLIHAGLGQLLEQMHLSRSFVFPFSALPEPRRSKLRFSNFGAVGFALAQVNPLSKATANVSSQAETYEWFAFSAPKPAVALREMAENAPRHSWLNSQKSVYDIQLEPAQTALYVLELGGLSCLAAHHHKKAALPGFDCTEPLIDAHQNSGQEVSATAGGRPSSQKRKNQKNRENVCAPVGRHLSNVVENFSGEDNSQCLLQVQSTDERKINSPQKSLLVCLSPSKKLIQTQMPDAVQFVFPSDKKSVFHLYEGAFTPAKISTLDLTDFNLVSKTQSVVGIAADAKSGPKITSIPTSASGIYECHSEKNPKHRQFYITQTDVFLGQRRIQPTTEIVWKIEENEKNTLDIRTLSWAEAARIQPSLDAFPGWDCLDAAALDVKCGIRVLQTTGQLALETLSGAADSSMTPAVRWHLYVASSLSLARVQELLPDWQLTREVALLSHFYRKQLSTLIASGQGSASTLAQLPVLSVPRQAPAESGAATTENAEKSSRGESLNPAEDSPEKLLSLLSLPEALWQKLQTP